MNTKKYIISFLVLVAVIIGATFFILKNKPAAVENSSEKNSQQQKNKPSRIVESPNPTSFNEFTVRSNNFKSLIAQKISQDVKNISVAIGIENDNYASGIFTVTTINPSASSTPNTNLFLAVKDKEQWQVVWTGQNNFPCAITSQYNIPKKIAPECQ